MRISDWSSDVCSSDLKPPKWQAAQASTIGNGLDTRAASAGIVSALTRPSAEYSATIAPPNAGVAPASVRIFGNQVNIEYVASDVMPNISAMPQPSEVRQTRPEERRVGKECVRTGRSRWSAET